MIKTDIGYYKVGDQIFDNKIDAITYAQQNNNEVDWYFFDEIFNKTNWEVEPESSLPELYRIRAIQIRESYDYIIVFCSGGADSNNVIRTFLDNNIHVDEVIGIAPESGLNNWLYNRDNLSEENTISEIKYAMFPLFKEIASKNPNIKLTINDYFEDILKYNSEEWLFDSCGNIVTVLTSQFTNVTKFKHIDKLIHQGKRIGLVYGTDKPIIRIDQNEKDLYFILSDSGTNYLNLPSNRKFSNVDRVLFYWTPNLPDLMVKQAHIVGKLIQLPEYKYLQNYLKVKYNLATFGNFENFIIKELKQNNKLVDKELILKKYLSTYNIDNTSFHFNEKSIYQRSIVPFIYPTTYDKDLFQCQKVDDKLGLFTKDQSWLQILHKNSKISEISMQGIKSLYNSISPRYLNYTGTGLLNKFKSYKFRELRTDL
jgi:hypothetical protein